MITLVLQLLYKANRILGLISKIFQYREPDMIIKLYKSLVRLIIEYGNHIWGPHYATDQTDTKACHQAYFHHIYPEGLQFLNLPSLYSKVKRRHDFAVPTYAPQLRLITVGFIFTCTGNHHQRSQSEIL